MRQLRRLLAALVVVTALGTAIVAVNPKGAEASVARVASWMVDAVLKGATWEAFFALVTKRFPRKTEAEVREMFRLAVQEVERLKRTTPSILRCTSDAFFFLHQEACKKICPACPN